MCKWFKFSLLLATGMLIAATTRPAPAALAHPSARRGFLSATPRVPECFGVNIHFTQPRTGEMRMLAAAGFRWIRMDFSWGATERVKGRYDFRPYDKLLAALRRYHIRPLWILDYGNPLYDHGLAPATPTDRRVFCRWVAAAMRHFRGHGIIWEMWNEPNGYFWSPRPNARAYSKLALAVGQTIRRVAPRELYVGPALGGIDMSFLRRCLPTGVLKYFDAVSIHPYRKPETVIPIYRKIKVMIARYEPPGRKIPIISSEWGYSSLRGGNVRQARMLARQFLVNLSQGIPLSIWYDWHNDGSGVFLPPPPGKVEFAQAAASTSSTGIKNLNLFAKGRQWTYSNGVEYPGAKGSFNLGQDGQTPVGIFQYDFAGGGHHVCASVNVSIKKISTLMFKVKSAHSQQILIRIVDSSGQTLQFGPPYSGAKHWQTLRLDLTHGSTVHWGGNNNGRIDFPIVTMIVGVYSPAPFPNAEFHYGTVKFKYHPHRHWVYTPKPAYLAARTLMTQLRGCRFVKRLNIGLANDYVLLFKGPKGKRIAAWTTASKARDIVLPLAAGHYRVTNETGTKTRTLVARANKLNLSISHDPEYIR